MAETTGGSPLPSNSPLSTQDASVAGAPGIELGCSRVFPAQNGRTLPTNVTTYAVCLKVCRDLRYEVDSVRHSSIDMKQLRIRSCTARSDRAVYYGKMTKEVCRLKRDPVGHKRGSSSTTAIKKRRRNRPS